VRGGREPAGRDERITVSDLRIGGMALREGVLLQSPDHWAAAVRLPDGSIKVRSGRKPRLPGHDALDRLPLARGVARMIEMTSSLPAMRRELDEPVLPQEDPTLLAATVASATATVFLRKVMKRAPLTRELMVAALSVFPALLAVRATELSRFHGAEHKSVAAYETGGDVESAAKEHDRCGSNLLGPLLLTNVAGGLFLRATGRDNKPLPTLLVGIVSLGSAFEIFSWMARHNGHPLADLLRAPGVTVQRLFTTREPTEDQLDVAQAALAELLRLEGREPEGAAQPTPLAAV
jgi:uncharacterized protein YqhQ